MGYISAWMGDRLSALLMSLMALLAHASRPKHISTFLLNFVCAILNLICKYFRRIDTCIMIHTALATTLPVSMQEHYDNIIYNFI